MSTLAITLWPLVTAPIGARALNVVGDGGRQSDEELIGQAQKGDPRAMQRLYQRHADMVYRRLTHLVGPDPEREDILQEVFLDFFRRLSSFRGEASLSTYLQRVAANKACDHLKRRYRQRPQTPLSDREVCPAPSPEQRAQGGEDAELFWRCLDELKPKKRIALVLRVVEGLTLKEIAEQVDATVHTVAQRIRHARMELVQLIKERKREEDDR